MQPTTYELKYCERCGTLLLRRSQSGENYCEPCQRALVYILFPGNSAPVRLGDGPRRRLHKIAMVPRPPHNFPAASPSTLQVGRLQ